MEILVLFKEIFGVDVQISEFIDVRIIIGLIALGFCIKHFSFFKKISNEYIPFILTLVSIVISIVLLSEYNTYTVANAFINSFLSAAISIGIHQQGKGFLKSFRPKEEEIEPPSEEDEL